MSNGLVEPYNTKPKFCKVCGEQAEFFYENKTLNTGEMCAICWERRK